MSNIGVSPLKIRALKNHAIPKAAPIPRAYIPSMIPILLRADAPGINTAIMRAYTGSRAEQLISGATRTVTKRSLRISMVRVAMMPGIAQAKEPRSGMNDFPWRPTRDMSRSMIKAARAMYPLSSSRPRKK